MGNEIVELTENMISELSMINSVENSVCLPIEKLSSLGEFVRKAFISFGLNSEIPVSKGETLFRTINVDPADVLKKAKDGSYWGAIRKADGTSKMAKFAEISPFSVKKAVTVNPALALMAATLRTLEKKLDKITKLSEQIVSFLENEKRSEIVADVQTLLNIISNYKYNWDNDMYLTNNHKMVLDIQRTARKNINFYQKTIDDLLSKKKTSATQKQTDALLNCYINAFQYLKMSLYTYSMASMLDVMISGNFYESYVQNKISEIQEISMNYRELFEKSSVFLEKQSAKTLSNNVLKGLGVASGTAGKVFSSIPVVKKGHVGKALINKSDVIKTSAQENDDKAVKLFAQYNNPQTNIFVEKLQEIKCIYKSNEILITEDNVYFIENKQDEDNIWGDNNEHTKN